MRSAAGPADDRRLALAGAVALHLAVLAVFLFRPTDHLLPMGTAVPVTIIAHDPTTDSRRAEAAPVTQRAQSPQPAPQPAQTAPPPPPSPARPTPKAPAPAPPRPSPAPALKTVKQPPQPKAAPTPPKPAPAARPQTKPAPPTDTFDLNRLASDVAKVARSSPTRSAAGPRGAARAETAPQARPDAGQGISQSDTAGLAQLLGRLWNKNCSLDETVVVPVSFSIGDDGRVQGRVDSHGAEHSANPAVAIAARRAIDAIHKAEPYAAAYRAKGQITVNFNAKKACADG
ncbi:MAG TPA: energy transducer TonB [Caulobacteraceae bacterium]|jgi:outer membrane biosynthesis protein TonB|nr:energy transducer TonB [Caulobacteraceae bacterium]